MHTCVRCGKQAGSIEEIHNGCPCGSKVFVFNKDAVQEQEAQPGQPEESAPSSPAPPDRADAAIPAIQLRPSQLTPVSSLMQQAITWEKAAFQPAQGQAGAESGGA